MTFAALQTIHSLLEAACTHNLTRHQLSEAQSAAVEAFAASNDFAVEYAAPIL